MATSASVSFSFPGILRKAFKHCDSITFQTPAKTESQTIIDTMKLQNIKRLEEIKALQDNWNENGAKHFSERLIDAAKELIGMLSTQPFIFPTARDSIQMEYEKENGDYLEFELFESGEIQMFKLLHDGEKEKRLITKKSADAVLRAFNGK